MARKADPAKFMPVSDILLQASPDLHGVMIRTIGRLFDHDTGKNLVWIQDPKTTSHVMAIDCSRITPFSFQNQRGLLYQFIGEVDCSQDKPILKALLYRCCEGLDIDTYIQAYKTRMDTLQQNLSSTC